MATKYKIEFNKLKATWKRRGTVKGKKHVNWSGKRGAFAAIAKAASKAAAKKKPAKRKATKKKATRKAPARKKPAAKKRKKAAKKKAPKRKTPRAKRKNASKKKAPRPFHRGAKHRPSEIRPYVVSGKTRKISGRRADELRASGHKVRLAKTKNPKGRRRASTRGKAGAGLLLTLLAGGVGLGVGYALGRKKA